jgi:two-component system response regulator AtoC
MPTRLPTDRESQPTVVMVADDDDDFRAALVATLQAGGHSTIEARDGQELLEMLERVQGDPSGLQPDVLITDVKMPRLSGLGVLEALRGARWNLAVVVVTALSDLSIDTVATRLGAVRVLHKPFDSDDLLAVVRDATR